MEPTPESCQSLNEEAFLEIGISAPYQSDCMRALLCCYIGDDDERNRSNLLGLKFPGSVFGLEMFVVSFGLESLFKYMIAF